MNDARHMSSVNRTSKRDKNYYFGHPNNLIFSHFFCKISKYGMASINFYNPSVKNGIQ